MAAYEWCVAAYGAERVDRASFEAVAKDYDKLVECPHLRQVTPEHPQTKYGWFRCLDCGYVGKVP